LNLVKMPQPNARKNPAHPPWVLQHLPRANRISDRLFLIIICLASLSFMFACAESSPKSRLEKRISLYLNRLESSAVDLQHELDKITDMKRLNTMGRMKEAISIITGSEKILAGANQDVAAYIAFINQNSRELKQEGLSHYIEIRDLLNQPLSIKRNAMDNYFQVLKKWLTYSATHFDRLEAKDPAARNSYDLLLTDVNRSLKRYDTANAQYHQFVKIFLTRNPNLVKQFKQEYKTMRKELGWI
jgi:uncharacterized protein YciI